MNINVNVNTDHKIKIGAHEIKVFFVEPEHPRLDGDQGAYNNYEIYINKKSAESIRFSTLLHEIIHAIEEIYTFSLDHVKLNLISESLAQALYQNKGKK